MIHVDLTGAAPFFGAHTPDYAAAEAARGGDAKAQAVAPRVRIFSAGRSCRAASAKRSLRAFSPRAKRSVKRATRSSLSASADRISAHARPMS